MKKMSLILIIALIFGLSAMAFAAVVEDYSSTINVFKDSPAVAKFFKNSYGHLMQKVSWLIQPMGELMQAHLQTLADYPPGQGGKTFDMPNVVQEFIIKAKQ